MINEHASPFFRPCLIDTGRFRWDFHNHDSLFQTSAESFATAEEAHESGMMELEHVEATAGIAKGPA
jgi:hypothetical protein